jgi:putative restriction endonuclease
LFDRSYDSRVRTAVFDWLRNQVTIYGDVLPWSVLLGGCEVEGRRVPLLSQQGIFKPAVLDIPLSIRTSPDGPYHDAFRRDGLLEYSYRGTDLGHRDNRGLRAAMAERLPLIYFHRMVPGRYLATWPVFIVADDPNRLVFSVAVDDATKISWAPDTEWVGAESPALRREYITTQARRRLHQRAFRERVLDAYRHRCALCRLKHDELLDAAHIIPDSDPEGEPVVSNGLALCQLHHGAFDRFFIGVKPDYTIVVRPDLLLEKDGPTLKHAIQALHGQAISVPRNQDLKPSEELLATRYDQFLEAASGA